MAEVVLNKVTRILSADMSSVVNKSVFERRLLSKVAINPSHVTVLNDVFVVPIESNYLADVKAVSQLVCRAVGRAYSGSELEPTVFDFSCSYPPPKYLGGSSNEKPVAMTVAARVSRKKKTAIAVQFVTRDAEHGKSICSGQQIFSITDEPLLIPGEQEAAQMSTVSVPTPLSMAGSDAVANDGLEDEFPTDREVIPSSSKLQRPGGLFKEKLKLLPTGEDGEVEDDYIVKNKEKRAIEEAARGQRSRRQERKPSLQTSQEEGQKFGGEETVEFVDADDDDDDQRPQK